MKRVNSITRKILLFAMLLFIMHDFAIGQSDIVVNSHETLKTCKASTTASALTVGEHHVFHAPFLLNKIDISIEDNKQKNNLYVLNTLNINEINTPLFTPPKSL